MEQTRQNDPSQKRGELDPLNDENSQFKRDTISYPIDIESLAHVMVFNINVQGKSKVSASRNASNPKSVTQTLQKDRLVGATVIDPGTLGNGVGFGRKTRRIKDSITLYVPENLQFSTGQEYNAPSLTEVFTPLGTSLVQATSDLTKAGSDLLAGKFMSSLKGVGSAFGSVVAGGTQQLLLDSDRSKTIMTTLTGYAVNPLIEVLYSSPTLRKFSFTFIFAPKNSQEADAVWKIIKKFRFHAAPEYPTTAGAGVASNLFVPPSEFDISFLRKTESGSFAVNHNLPKIATCVMTGIDTDYTPDNQFVTFKDGMPVHIRMTLSFLETTILTKEDIGDENFENPGANF